MAGSGNWENNRRCQVGFALTEAESQLLNGGNRRRPAAIDQLVTLGKQIQVPVFELGAMLTRWRLDRGWSRAGQRC